MEYSAPHGEPQAERPVLSRRDAPSAHPHSERGESRTEKLARIRREIELGTYDTPERLEAAFAIMLGRLQNE